MDPYTRESKFWYALAYGKPQELPEPVSATEHYMRLFALKQLGGQKAENALEIKAAAKGEEFLGKKTEDLVFGVEILFDGTTAYLSGTAPSIGQTTASICFTSFPFCLLAYSYALLLPVSYYKSFISSYH